jgi:hypothetical protein
VTGSPTTRLQGAAPADPLRTKLIADRLRQNTRRAARPPDSRLPWYALEHAIAGDLGHLHAAHDLRELPTSSNRSVSGPILVRVKRVVRRLLHPLPEAQSVWNGANARVITFMLRQLAAQARTIESLEQQISELHDKLDA